MNQNILVNISELFLIKVQSWYNVGTIVNPYLSRKDVIDFANPYAWELGSQFLALFPLIEKKIRY